MPKINDWGVLSTDPQNPREGLCILTGVVFGHTDQEKCPDGEVIFTSPVQMLDPKGHVGITNNTKYDLGEPSADWLQFLDERNASIEDYEFDKRN